MSSRKTENERKGKIGELVEEWEVGFVGVNVSEMEWCALSHTRPKPGD